MLSRYGGPVSSWPWLGFASVMCPKVLLAKMSGRNKQILWAKELSPRVPTSSCQTMNGVQSNNQIHMEINKHEQGPAETGQKQASDGETVDHRLEYKSLQISAGNSELNSGLADRKGKKPTNI